MARSGPRGTGGVKSAVVLLFLIGIVAYFALTAIPAAQRPTLRPLSPEPSVANSAAPRTG